MKNTIYNIGEIRLPVNDGVMVEWETGKVMIIHGKEVREKTIESLQASLSTDIKELDYDDAEKFYEMFGDNDFQVIADKIGASALQACIEDAIENGDSEDDFVKRLEWYGGVEMNDLDIRDAARSLYEKYVM